MTRPVRILVLVAGVALVIAGRANDQMALTIVGFVVIGIGLVFRLLQGRKGG